jgi:hypothetical protein
VSDVTQPSESQIAYTLVVVSTPSADGSQLHLDALVRSWCNPSALPAIVEVAMEAIRHDLGRAQARIVIPD